jgi:transposase-like protein
MPIICDRVNSNSIIHTDEHRSYLALGRLGYLHGTVCHKYNFVDRLPGVYTQAVESFNNMIKHEIKKRKGVRTADREMFLAELT